MKFKYLLSIICITISAALSAANRSTLTQIASMLSPVECSVSEISDNAVNVAKIAKTTVDISNRLSDIKSSIDSYVKSGHFGIEDKLNILQTVQSLLSNSWSQSASISKLVTVTKDISSLANVKNDPEKRFAAKKSLEYCSKLLDLCNTETKSQINTATQILKLIKESK